MFTSYQTIIQSGSKATRHLDEQYTKMMPGRWLILLVFPTRSSELMKKAFSHACWDRTKGAVCATFASQAGTTRGLDLPTYQQADRRSSPQIPRYSWRAHLPDLPWANSFGMAHLHASNGRGGDHLPLNIRAKGVPLQKLGEGS